MSAAKLKPIETRQQRGDRIQAMSPRELAIATLELNLLTDARAVIAKLREAREALDFLFATGPGDSPDTYADGSQAIWSAIEVLGGIVAHAKEIDRAGQSLVQP